MQHSLYNYDFVFSEYRLSAILKKVLKKNLLLINAKFGRSNTYLTHQLIKKEIVFEIHLEDYVLVDQN